MVPRDNLDLCGKSRTHWDRISGPSKPQLVSLPTALSPAAYFHFIHAIGNGRRSYAREPIAKRTV